jgi:hypothetical protein
VVSTSSGPAFRLQPRSGPQLGARCLAEHRHRVSRLGSAGARSRPPTRLATSRRIAPVTPLPWRRRGSPGEPLQHSSGGLVWLLSYSRRERATAQMRCSAGGTGTGVRLRPLGARAGPASRSSGGCTGIRVLRREACGWLTQQPRPGGWRRDKAWVTENPDAGTSKRSPPRRNSGSPPWVWVEGPYWREPGSTSAGGNTGTRQHRHRQTRIERRPHLMACTEPVRQAWFR